MAGYVIRVGQHSPTKVLIGRPNQDGRPGPDAIEAFRQVGACLIVARSKVWARRVYPDGKLGKSGEQEIPVEVLDPKYKGGLEFLEWQSGKTGAQLMEIRYLPTSNTLDFEYQTLVQKIIPPRPEEGLDHIQLSPGENKFDPNKQALLIQFLEVTHDNRDSKSKNPDPMIKGYMFYTVDDQDSDKTFIRKTEASTSAKTKIIAMSSVDGQLQNVFEILAAQGVDFGTINHLSPPTDIYTALLKYADEFPEDYGKRIEQYKKKVQDQFEYAESFKALDLTKDGVIALHINGKTDIVWDNAEGKGRKMIEWVAENFSDPKVYQQTKHFISLCAKLK